MAELIAQNLAPIMFGALVLFLLFGYPVAFALAANGCSSSSSRSSSRPTRRRPSRCPGRC
jgi:hypothetical protein